MNYSTNSLDRLAGVLCFVGAGVVLLGTYSVTWFHLSGYRGADRTFNYGGFTLHQLASMGGASWYSNASSVMVAGAVVLSVAGICALNVLRAGWIRAWSPIAMAIGTALVAYAVLRTGLPYWQGYGGVLHFARGPGEWVCLMGAGCGLIALLLAITARWQPHHDQQFPVEAEREPIPSPV